jgi:hypothetical protein
VADRSVDLIDFLVGLVLLGQDFGADRSVA